MKAVMLEVRDPDGTLVKRVAVNEDLLKEYLERRREGNGAEDLTTLWFFRLWAALLTPADAGISISFSFTDEGGTSRTQGAKGNMSTYGFFLNTYNCANKMVIAVGTGAASPTRTDYKLTNKIAEAFATISVDEAALTITLSASFTFSADTVIYEVGLLWVGCVATSATCGRFLVDRTVFPNGISVGAGQTLSVAYVFTL
jgi:hypothetical protein